LSQHQLEKKENTGREVLRVSRPEGYTLQGYFFYLTEDIHRAPRQGKQAAMCF